MYELGDGVTTDKSKAIELYQRAIKLGSNRGMVAYANALIRGNGVRKDKEQAHSLLKNAVSNNSASAKYVLGAYYRSGELSGGTPWKNLASDAADRGNDDARILLLIDEIDVNEDPVKTNKAFIKLREYRGKNSVVDLSIANYYLNNTSPPAIQSAKEIAEPLAANGSTLASALMVQVSMLSGDLPNAIRYMRDVNKESPGSFDVEKYSKEYKKYLNKKSARRENKPARPHS